MLGKEYEIKKKILVSLVVFVVAGIIFANFLINKQLSNKITLTVAYENSQLDAILFVAKEQKILERHLPNNINVEWVMMDSGSDRRDALATERASIATINNMRIITAIENDYPIRILANGMGQPVGLYALNSELVYPDDMIGKTIAYQGAYSIPLKTDLRKKLNITTGDYQLLMVGGDQELIDLLIQEQVDAVIMNNEKAAKAITLRPDVRELYDLTTEYNRLGMRNWFVGSSTFFEKHPELLESIMSAYKEAVEQINNDPAGMAELIAPLLEMDATQIEKGFRALPPVIEVYGYDEMTKILLENGDIDKPAKLFNQLPNYDSIPKK